MADQPTKTKRAAKRYPYPRTAICEVAGDKLEVQLLNISASGIQFATRTDIQSKEAIKISWRDGNIGLLEPTVVIARKIHQPELKDFQFFYGSQYYSLKPEMKQTLLKLLKSLKEEDTNEAFRQVVSVPTHHIFDVINKSGMFLQGVFNGGEKKAPFESIINEIKDYEQMAFTKVDPLSGTIQRLTTNNFHCQLLTKMVLLLPEKNELGPLYFEHVFKKMEEIAEIEREIKEILDDPHLEKNPQRKILQKLFRESANRLFYSQQTMLHNILETLSNNDYAATNWSTQLIRVKADYEKLVATTSTITSVEDSQLTYKRRTKKPDEFSKVDVVVDIPALSEKKPNFTVIFGVFFIIVFLIGLGGYKLIEMKEKKTAIESLSLPIEILEFKREGSQMSIVVATEVWTKAPDSSKNEAYRKVIQFLQKERSVSSFALFLNNHTLIRTLYKTSIVPSDANAAQPKTTAPQPATAPTTPPEQTPQPTQPTTAQPAVPTNTPPAAGTQPAAPTPPAPTNTPPPATIPPVSK